MKRTLLTSPWPVVLLILLFFFLALDSMIEDSPTMDEQNHLARGLAFLHTGDPRFNLEHPPLINTLSALPLLMLRDVRLPTDHPSWERPEGWYEFADLLLWQYNDDVTRMIFLSRLPTLFLTMGVALTGFRFARHLWGRAAALPALFLLLFEPNIMAHGRYTTTDLGGAAFLLLTCFMLWKLWNVDGWPWRPLLSLTLVLALTASSKFSLIAFVPIFGLMALLPFGGTSSRTSYLSSVARRLLQLLVAGLLTLPFIWAFYGFQWGAFIFRSEWLMPLNDMQGAMPTFWAGIEKIVVLTGGGRGNAFLLGRFSDQGFPEYFPIAFLSKTPSAILFLLPVAAWLLLKKRATRVTTLFLLLPAILFFALSTQSKLTIGYRHLLPIVPLFLLVISGLAPRLSGIRDAAASCGKRVWSASYYILLGTVLIGDLVIHPHYLSYFNAAAGGPENGYRILVDSNIDWGQDLLRLKHWMAVHKVDEVNLAWFGSADPAYYAISYRPLPGLGRAEFFLLWWDVPFNRQDPEPGVYAISVSNLWELPLQVEEKSVFAWFRDREPDDRVGYSILIYRVP